MAKAGVLYISYDGMLEPLGQSQVLAYLRKLAEDRCIVLMSFEKPADWADDARRTALADSIKAAGIRWVPLTYHKSPSLPATLFDLAQGMVVALWLALRHRLRIVHTRSYLPAAMALPVKLFTGARFLFDMRGLWPDERVDGGLWPKGGRVYRAVKALERHLLLKADHVVTLTDASLAEIRSFPYLQARTVPMTMIPTCADLDHFNRSSAPPPAPFTLGYLGSVGTWYLFDEVLECFALIRARVPGARLLIVNRNEQDFIRGRLAVFGVEASVATITAAQHQDVPKLIAQMTAGAAIIKPVYSKIASAPTKLAEYLGCGVPCIGNDRVGDMEAILEGERVGVALTDFSAADRQAAVDRLFTLLEDPGLATRCRSVAQKLFSLDTGVTAYRAIYAGLDR